MSEFLFPANSNSLGISIPEGFLVLSGAAAPQLSFDIRPNPLQGGTGRITVLRPVYNNLYGVSSITLIGVIRNVIPRRNGHHGNPRNTIS
jgi:hypothetical protein